METDVLSVFSNPLVDNLVEKCYDDRIIIINTEITDDLLEYVCLSIMRWNCEDKDLPIEKRKRIKIVISSNGGDSIEARQIISSIETSITPVDTIGFSKCCSAAIYIFLAGHRRYCFPNTIFLIHDGYVKCSTTGSKAKDVQKFFDSLDEDYEKYLQKKTNMDEDYIQSIRDRECYIFAAEAKQYGIVDQIIGVDCDLNIL